MKLISHYNKLFLLILLSVGMNGTSLLHSEKENIILGLFESGAIKFGSFKLKSGIISPIYIDLRNTISFPKLLHSIALAYAHMINPERYDFVCGVPYGALPIATIISQELNLPMVMRRKESKDHGTKKMVEGVFNRNSRVVIIEDIITSGASILETITDLIMADLQVTDIFVLIDRQQNGIENVSQKGYCVHAYCTISEVLSVLYYAEKIGTAQYEQLIDFIHKNKVS